MGGNRELAERFIASLEARDWEAWAALLDPDVVYEIPQSRERIRGRNRYLQFNQEYPGDWHLRPKVTVADERHGAVWFEWLADGRADDAVVFFEFADGLITRVTDFWPEPYEPPSGREHLVERWLPALRRCSAHNGLVADPDPGRIGDGQAAAEYGHRDGSRGQRRGASHSPGPAVERGDPAAGGDRPGGRSGLDGPVIGNAGRPHEQVGVDGDHRRGDPRGILGRHGR